MAKGEKNADAAHRAVEADGGPDVQMILAAVFFGLRLWSARSANWELWGDSKSLAKLAIADVEALSAELEAIQ